MATGASSILADRDRGYRRRVLINHIATGGMILCALVALIPLFLVAFYVLQQGWTAVFSHFPAALTQHQVPQGPGIPAQDTGQNLLIDGLKGTALLIALSSAVGLPIGILSGIYLAEYGHNRFGDTVRFVTDVLAGLPSIVAGIVANALLVVTVGTYSVFAGAVALGLLMFPTVTRTTEGVVRLVPDSLREGGLALGVARWRVILSVVVPSALSGIITGIILGIARVAGETAPLIFTILGNNYGFVGWTQPMAALPLQIYNFIVSPPDGDTAVDAPYAYAGVMILLVFVVSLNLIARYLASRRSVARS